MPVTAKALREKRAALIKEARAIVDKAEKETRDQTPEERSRWTAIMGGNGADNKPVAGEVETLKLQIDEMDKLEGLETSLTQPRNGTQPGTEGRTTDGNGEGRDTVPATAKDTAAESRLGFKSFGEFALEVRQYGTNRTPTARLQQVYANPEHRAIIGMNEGIASEGGALIPPAFMAKIFSRLNAAASIFSKTDHYPITSDTMSWPRNLESSRVSGSRYGGIQTYWRGEGSAPTPKFPKTGKFTLNLHKLISLAGVTNELLKDAPACEQYLTAAFSEDMAFEADAAIVGGTGSGQPQGLKNAPCKVSVAKETNQVADTVVPANVVKMWSRLWKGCRDNAAWLINQDIEPQLNLMSFGLGTAGVMMYMPPGGLSDAPYATLMGKPVISVEQCETLGDEGDIILTDLKHYITATNGGPEAAVSAHLYFDSDQMAFRLTWRIDGAPWWASALTPYKGSATQSCVVTLAARA